MEEAVSDLKKLFASFGEVENGVTWSILDDDKISEIRKIVDHNPALKATEDWSFLDSGRCFLWISSNENGINLYKVPLEKIDRSMDIGSKPDCDTCSASLRLKTVDNERAIKHLIIYDFGKFMGHDYHLTDENEVFISLSSRDRIDQARRDFATAAQACREEPKANQ